MKRIYKYDVQPGGVSTVSMHRNAMILSVDQQTDNDIKIWALVETDNPLVPRHFFVAGTGHDLPQDIYVAYQYVGTVHIYEGRIVLHVFEEMK